LQTIVFYIIKILRVAVQSPALYEVGGKSGHLRAEWLITSTFSNKKIVPQKIYHRAYRYLSARQG